MKARSKAAIGGWAAGLGTLIFLPMIVDHNFVGDRHTLNFIWYAISALIGGAMGLYLESQKEKPYYGNVVLTAMLSFIGIGMATFYMLLPAEERRKELE